MEEKDYKKLYEDVVALAKDGLKDGLYLSQSAKAVTEYLFPQLKETEEEKARKGLVRFLINFNNGNYSRPSENEIDSWIKWINKKCEQKPVECIKFDNEFENQISHIIASVLNGEHEYNEGFVKYASQSLLGFANKDQNHTDKVEPKFKAGDCVVYNRNDSSEDEHCIELLLPIIDSSSLIPKNRKKCKEFLKSLKSQTHWKPSKDQMFALSMHIQENPNLESLYNDLKKL